MWFVAMVVLDR